MGEAGCFSTGIPMPSKNVLRFPAEIDFLYQTFFVSQSARKHSIFLISWFSWLSRNYNFATKEQLLIDRLIEAKKIK